MSADLTARVRAAAALSHQTDRRPIGRPRTVARTPTVRPPEYDPDLTTAQHFQPPPAPTPAALATRAAMLRRELATIQSELDQVSAQLATA